MNSVDPNQKIPPDIMKSIDELIESLQNLKNIPMKDFDHLVLSIAVTGQDPANPERAKQTSIITGTPSGVVYAMESLLHGCTNTLPGFTDMLIEASEHKARQRQATQDGEPDGELVTKHSLKYFTEDGGTVTKEQLDIPEPTSTRKH